MPDLLLEFFSEEIPARMQAKAAEDLRKGVTDRLVAAGLLYEGAKAFVTPRRLALWVQGLPARQPDLREEKKGPRVGAPEKAIEGFLKGAGLTSIDQAKVQPDKKGDFYIAVIEKPGRAAIDVIAEVVPEVARAFPWPKSMRWGKQSEKPGSLTWVRPLHSIVATFGPETETPDIVPITVGGIVAGDTTRGHRFLSPQPFEVRRLDDYAAKLEAAKVVLDPARRQEIILADAKNLAFAQGFELMEDAGLLAEVAGLVEWPVVLMGAFDEAFLSIPPEVIRTTIRNNQKCFVLRKAASPLTSPWRGEVAAHGAAGGGERADGAPGNSAVHPTPPRSLSSGGPAGRPVGADPPPPGEGEAGELANRFILVANTEAVDGGAAIIAGNERVIRARLSDAKFFYETDLKAPLESRLERLKQIVFHEKLGTQYERVERIERLARELAPIVGADADKAARAARLAKADLVTEMVGEFPELQGLMGKYYALAQGEDASVARAIEEHYKPLGQGDSVPADPVSIAVALADKIDTLVGFWAIDEKPTGSKDPYGLRRAALGVIRLILDRKIRVSLVHTWTHPLRFSVIHTNIALQQMLQNLPAEHNPEITSRMLALGAQATEIGSRLRFNAPAQSDELIVLNSLVSFFTDRLKVQLREQGARHDLVDAVLAPSGPPPTSPWRGEVAARSDAGGGERAAGAPDGSAAHPTPPRSLSSGGPAGRPVGGDPPPPGEGKASATLQVPAQDDLLLIVRRVEALGKFLDTDDGKNLLAGYKRATNIIRIEEKKDARQYSGTPDASLYQQKEERELAFAITAAKQEAEAAVAREDFAQAMHAIATLRPFVDAFFDKVTVNADDKAVRENRLKLLNEIREATRAVADFSKIEG